MTVVNALSKQPDRPRSWVSIIFGLWCGTLYSVVIGSKLLLPGEGESTSQIAALVAAIVWPLGYFLFSRNRSVAARIRGDFLAALYVFSLFCLLSCFNSPIALKSIAYTGLTLVGVWIAVQFIFRMEARQFETGLKIYALINIPVLVSFAAYDYVPGVRLGLGKDISIRTPLLWFLRCAVHNGFSQLVDTLCINGTCVRNTLPNRFTCFYSCYVDRLVDHCLRAHAIEYLEDKGFHVFNSIGGTIRHFV